jgi:SAM-dependent methyltransferase
MSQEWWVKRVFDKLPKSLRKLIADKMWLQISTALQRSRIAIERVVEEPFVLFNVMSLPRGSKVLDVGCAGSTIPIELASLGYKVIGIDLCPYPHNHPNFTFIQGDFLKVSISNESFDCVTAISSIEHFGLDPAGQALENGDLRAVINIHRILKPKGLFIFTVPYGVRAKTSWYRVYDETSLRQLLHGFKIIKEEYFCRKYRKYWFPATKYEASIIDSSSPQRGWVNSVALIVAQNVEGIGNKSTG